MYLVLRDLSIGKIFLKPVKAIEVIDLYFTITAAGGSFIE